MRIWQRAGIAVAALLITVIMAGCTSGNSKPKTPSPAPPAARTATGSPPTGTSRASQDTPAAGRGTPATGAILSGCTGQTGPRTPVAGNASPTPEAPFVAGTQPVRPAVDLTQLTVPPDAVPAGYVASIDGRVQPQSIARDAASPPAALNHLNNIGLLGGKELGWTGPTIDGRIPTLYVQYLIFGTDAGAAEFLRAPVFGANLCIRSEASPLIGQETSGLFYQFETPLQGGSTGSSDGHGIFWRCGRVLLGVTGASAPGKITQNQIGDLARRVQAEFIKSQPCA